MAWGLGGDTGLSDGMIMACHKSKTYRAIFTKTLWYGQSDVEAGKGRLLLRNASDECLLLPNAR